MKRLLAIGFIWLCSAAAWAILGGSLVYRSEESSGALGASVSSLWGPPLEQLPPSATGKETHRVKEKDHRWDEKRGKLVEVELEKEVSTERPLVLSSSDLSARIDLAHRRKGLLWFPTYAVAFEGRYALRNATPEARDCQVVFPLEGGGVIYDGFQVIGGGGEPIEVGFEQENARFSRRLEAGESLAFTVRYLARGTSAWHYGREGLGLGPEQGRARDFRLLVETSFPNVDFPPGALSPSRQERHGRGWRGEWRFEQLVGTKAIGIAMPQRLNPGPLAARITFFAPVGLLFFFFLNATLLAARRRSIHPMNWFLFACAFFAFHLLFAYLIDHLEVGLAFALASVVALALSVSYARLFVGWRTAALQVGGSQLVYLILFSFTFFWQGFTGLSITVGAIATLFLVMQVTGRIDWEAALARPPPGGGRPEARAGVAP